MKNAWDHERTCQKVALARRILNDAARGIVASEDARRLAEMTVDDQGDDIDDDASA